MLRYSLDGRWIMSDRDGNCLEGTIPGSVYSFLLDAGKMEDPYYGDNELKALSLMEDDYTFIRHFDAPSDLLKCRHQVLRLDGVDTLAEVYLNSQRLGRMENMHSFREFPVEGILRREDNELKLLIESPIRYIKGADEKHHLGGSLESMRGFPHLRKAHCMFGWDWGPRLPDMGIWKSVSLLGWESFRISDVRITQHHMLADDSDTVGDDRHAPAAENEQVRVSICVDVAVGNDVLRDDAAPKTGHMATGACGMEVFLTGPDGRTRTLAPGQDFEIPEPALWWPNGLGEQPLYTVKVILTDENGSKETVEKRIGLRTLTMQMKKDQWGETFAAQVNGRTFFSMGADYIPEDCILSRLSCERTRKLLEDCAASHFNVIRVWGGGFYPHDYFYDLCDELGLVVWQDMMFSCANYRITPTFVESITEEITQNVRRIRHHASLGLWCGNNEMEQFALVREFDGDDVTAADYLIQNEYIIPEILRREDPQTFYWPSSPSSGGKFVYPLDPDRGDVHDWSVWHGGEPFTAYRKHFYRYLSEFGFQAFPCMETIRSFVPEEEQNVFSYVMEMHQRNAGANGKILQYLAATFLYPVRFEMLVYASQLLQAEAIRYGVEHFRRNRGGDRCMGTVYWQLNDNWPVASWSSVDYYGRWKALQYYAIRFFAPVLLSCEEDGQLSQGRTCISEPASERSRARFHVTNETKDEIHDVVEWELRDRKGTVLESGTVPVTVPAFDTCKCEELDFSRYSQREVHVSFRLRDHGSPGSALFVPPKHYRFADPKLEVSYDSSGGKVTVTAGAYAKAVEIYRQDGYIRLDDNFFDMEPGKRTVRILEGEAKHLRVRSVYDIGR